MFSFDVSLKKLLNKQLVAGDLTDLECHDAHVMSV